MISGSYCRRQRRLTFFEFDEIDVGFNEEDAYTMYFLGSISQGHQRVRAPPLDGCPIGIRFVCQHFGFDRIA